MTPFNQDLTLPFLHLGKKAQLGKCILEREFTGRSLSILNKCCAKCLAIHSLYYRNQQVMGAQCNHNSKHNAKKKKKVQTSKWGRNLTSIKFVQFRYSVCIHKVHSFHSRTHGYDLNMSPQQSIHIWVVNHDFPGTRMTADSVWDKICMPA